MNAILFSVLLGTDGRDYISRCHLESEACSKRLDRLSVQYSGRCNPCEGHHCDDGKECHIVDEDGGTESEEYYEYDNGVISLGNEESRRSEPSRVPTCMCDTNCPDDYAPVCASNGKTVRRTTFNRIR